MQTIQQQYLEQQGLRKCTRCNSTDLPKDLDVCHRCISLLVEMSKGTNRQCTKCKQLVIPASSPSAVTLCTPCFESTLRAVNRMCGACGAYNIAKTDWRDRCTPCFREKREVTEEYKKNYYKACDTCSELNILKSNWMKVCTRCYKEAQSKCKECGCELNPSDKNGMCFECIEATNDLKRECSKCGDRTIPYSAPVTTIICDRCVEEGPKRECESCHQMNVPESWPKYRKTCIPCFKLSKNGR